MSNEPCPFCWSTMLTLADPPWQDDLGNRVYCIQCEGCGTDGPAAPSPEGAWLRWNTRHVHGEECKGDNGMTERPTKTDAMRLAAATELVADMVKNGVLSADEINGHAEDIAKVTRYGETDGYKIARELESRHYWDCDMATAEALEGFHPILERIYCEAERLWADANPHEPPFAPGAIVIWRGEPATIVDFFEYQPQCYKVRQGDMKPGSYYIVPFEDVTA